jgi:hypothetical protein
MRTRILLLSIILLGTLSFTQSCKKNRLVKNETGQVSEDNSQIQQGMDAAVYDGTNAMSGNSSINGRVMNAAAITVCGATTDTSQKAQGIITLNFDGSTICNGRIRAGMIKLTLVGYTTGTRWKTAGAVCRMDFTDYKVTRSSDSKSLVFNGTANVTNVSGGNIVLLTFGLQPNVIHKIESGAITVKFDDGKTSTCNLSRQFTYTYSNGVYQVKGEGVGSKNGLSSIENWGTTRDGDEFTSQVTQPVIWNSTCGAHKPVSGKLDIQVASKEFGLVTTLGVDNSGNVVSSGCPWGLKVEWTYKNKSGSKLYAYN